MEHEPASFCVAKAGIIGAADEGVVVHAVGSLSPFRTERSPYKPRPHRFSLKPHVILLTRSAMSAVGAETVFGYLGCI